MTQLLIIATIAFTVAMVVYMLYPFTISRDEQVSFELLDEDLRQIEALMARKTALVQSLRDIEYDWKTNKISREDYERFKKSCERQAVAVMRRLDAIHGGGDDWAEVIDRAVADRVKEFEELDELHTSPVDEVGVDPTASMTLDCTVCGQPLKADDRFCSQCGAPVQEEEDSPANRQPPGLSPRPSEAAGW